MERYDLPSNPVASSEQAGVLRIASEVDEKNCGCVDAAITPSNLYSLLDCRKANTAYAAGVIVTCPYHKEFLLKCTTGGTTSANSLDTTAVTKGSVITDGGVKWTVIASQIIDLSISGKIITVTFIDGTQKTLTTQDTNTFTGSATSIGGASATKPAVVVTTYRNGNDWYRVWSDGWIEQGGVVTGKSGNQNNTENYQTVTLHKAFDNANYNVAFSLNIAGIATAIDTFTQIWSKASNQFQVRLCDTGNTNTLTYTWYACGKGA